MQRLCSSVIRRCFKLDPKPIAHRQFCLSNSSFDRKRKASDPEFRPYLEIGM